LALYFFQQLRLPGLAHVLIGEGVFISVTSRECCPAGIWLKALFDDKHALLDLGQTAEITVEIIALRPHGDFEIDAIINQIRVRPPHIIRNARRAQEGPGDAVGQRVFLGNDPVPSTRSMKMRFFVNSLSESRTASRILAKAARTFSGKSGGRSPLTRRREYRRS